MLLLQLNNKFNPKLPQIATFFTLFFILLFASTNGQTVIDFGPEDTLQKYRQAKITLSPKEKGNISELKLTVLFTTTEMEKGVSGIASAAFPEDAGVLFFYFADGVRRFWMPDTYFDLDIIFLDEKFKVISIARNMPAHPGRKNIHSVAKTSPTFARHVLEIKSKSAIAKLISEGMTLPVQFPFPPQEIEPNIHHQK